VPFFTDIRVVAGDDIAFLGSRPRGSKVDHSPDGGRTWQMMTVGLAETVGTRLSGSGVEFTAVTDDGWAIGSVGGQQHVRAHAQDPASIDRVQVPRGFMPPQPAGNLIYAEELFDDNDLARELRLVISVDHGDTGERLTSRATRHHRR